MITPLTPLLPKILSTAVVNQRYRTEALVALLKQLHISFNHQTTLSSFCKFISSEWRNLVTSIAIHRVEGQDPEPIEDLLSFLKESLPKLLTIHLSLLPRELRTRDAAVCAWGPATVKLLKDISEVGVRSVLKWRCVHDCERFEKEYVGENGWKIVEEDRVDGRRDLQPGMPAMCRVVCQLHQISVSVT